MTKKLTWQTVSTKDEPDPYKMQAGGYLINGCGAIRLTFEGTPIENPKDICVGHPEWSQFQSVWGAMAEAERHYNAATS